ncbi:hypothetical protein BDV95DRAFT_506193 [Massariosphaeria phaeospora]|uniref:Uncharacterized protein n=1 Tax=Massariosphaeria phaeospora TaxID=100035 RepID=A0A7C8I701_9PLEO|nr:hypothetical protein BDV95DRAFT_506193 [Massariosphaeria phaeospora]
MSTVGDMALGGDWERISNYKFNITENMMMSFQGRSCNITDGGGALIEKLGDKDGLAERHVLPGYQCFVMKAKVKFVRKDG